MNPIAQYIGGKARQAGWIASHIDPLNAKVYVEPFCGVASVFFAKNPSRIEVLNDTNSAVYYLFKALRTCPNEFVEFCKSIEYGEQVRKEAYRIVLGGARHNAKDHELGAYAYFLMVSSFSGNFICRTLGRTVVGKGVAKAWNDRVEGLGEYVTRLKDAVILNRDGFDVIQEYDKPGVVMYIDPPYFSSGFNYGNKDDFQHERLAAVLNSVRHAKVLLSHYHIEPYISLYEGWKVETRKSSQSIRGNSECSNREGLDVIEAIFKNF